MTRCLKRPDLLYTSRQFAYQLRLLDRTKRRGVNL